MILSVDPGKINGYAIFRAEDGECIYLGQGRQDELFNVMKRGYQVIVCENFRLRPDKSKQQSWSELETVRMIGALEYAAHIMGAEFVLQEPSIKPIAYKRAGVEVPKSHAISHQSDAYVHGVHYMLQAGIVSPVKYMKGAEKHGPQVEGTEGA